MQIHFNIIWPKFTCFSIAGIVFCTPFFQQLPDAREIVIGRLIPRPHHVKSIICKSRAGRLQGKQA